MSNKKTKYKIRLTRLGIWLVFLTIFLLFSAQNTGNNLLYLVCSCIFTAIMFGLGDILSVTVGLKAKLVYPDISFIGQKVYIICKIAKNNVINRYYLRFEDSWLEKIAKGDEGYLIKEFVPNQRGCYEFHNLSIFIPGMLDIFYCQYVFPEIVIYAVEDYNNGNEKIFSKNKEQNQFNKGYSRDGDFHSFELYQENDDASKINWVVSARSNEEWVTLRENTNDEKKLLEKYSEGLKNFRIPFEKYEFEGKNYKDLSEISLKKELNPFVFRLMLLLALLVCFGIYNIGYLQSLIPYIAIIFAAFAIKGKAINGKIHKYIYFSSLFVAFYIIGKSFWGNTPAKIVLLLEFSLLILLLQYITMISIRNIIGALTLVLMILLGIAAMNVNSAFPILFLTFLVLSSMLLSFLRVNLVATDAVVKNNYSANPKGISGTIFLLIVFTLLWIPFFYLIPRTKSYGIASNLADEGKTKGFSNNTLDLNSSGLLEDNLTVVLRIIPNDEISLNPSVIRRLKYKRLRGGSFSSYENGEWKKTRRGLYVRNLQNTVGEVIIDRKFENFKSLHNFVIILEGTDTPTVFIPEQTKKINFHEYAIGMELDGSMFFLDKASIFNKRYVVSLDIGEQNYGDSSLDDLLNFDYYYNLSQYISTDGFSNRIFTLTNNIGGDSKSINNTVKLVLDYLQNNYDYSQDQLVIPNGQDPIDYFLFEGKTGNCQHFASAMVFLLRCKGIPSRVVNGYLISEWNETGVFFTVRQSDAHAWVEVFFPKFGWVPFDPTPLDLNEKTSRFSELWNKLVEIYEGYWFNYVYSFDERTQRSGRKNFIYRGLKQFSCFFASPTILFTFALLLLIYWYYRNGIKSLCRYIESYSNSIPWSYFLWENKISVKRLPSETPSEFHNRLLKEKVIDSYTRDILFEVEELIDEYAYKKGANKFELSRKIKLNLQKASNIWV